MYNDVFPLFRQVAHLTTTVERLVNAKTNSAYKLPLFYLIDSIMKHVGGTRNEITINLV